MTEHGTTEHETVAQEAPDRDAPEHGVTAVDGERRRGLFTDRGIGILLTVGSAVSLWASFALAMDKIKLLENPDFVPACNFSILMSCKSVINSEQGSVFGFPNPFLGLFGFGVLLALGVAAAARVRFPRWYWVGALAGLTFAVVMVHWFATQSIFVIEVLCPWCMVVWSMVVPMFWYTLLHVAGKFTDAGWLRALRSWHLVPVVLWYLGVAATILVHFWDSYWKDYFGSL